MDAETLFLGVIALATLIMAFVQIGVIVYGARLTRKVNALMTEVEHELKPTLSRLNALSDDVHRVTTVAASEAERAGQLFARVSDRVETLTCLTQDAIVEPMRQGAALVEAVRAAVAVFRRSDPDAAQGADEEPESAESPADDRAVRFVS